MANHQGFQPVALMAGHSLGELIGPSKRLAARLCKTHKWREAKYSRTCTRCGFVEDK